MRKENWVLYYPGFIPQYPNDYVAYGWTSGELMAVNKTVEVISLAAIKCGVELIDYAKNAPRYLDSLPTDRIIAELAIRGVKPKFEPCVNCEQRRHIRPPAPGGGEER